MLDQPGTRERRLPELHRQIAAIFWLPLITSGAVDEAAEIGEEPRWEIDHAKAERTHERQGPSMMSLHVDERSSLTLPSGGTIPQRWATNQLS